MVMTPMMFRRPACAIALLFLCDASRGVHGNSNDYYGVDVSFPMQHKAVSSVEKPFGDSKQEFYDAYMQACRDTYPNDDTCDSMEDDRIYWNLNQPAAMRNYTVEGYKKIKCPEQVYQKLRQFWDANRDDQRIEQWDAGDPYVNHWESPTYVLYMPHRLEEEIRDTTKPILEEWSSQNLEPSSLYGIRVYKRGSVLTPHVDQRHMVTSAIINVDQNVDEPWPLEVIGRDGRSHNVTIEPGDMVLYESHSIIHGRPFPFRGDYFANVFVHFKPDVEDIQDEFNPDYVDENEEENAEEGEQLEEEEL